MEDRVPQGEPRGPKRLRPKIRVQCNFTPEDYHRMEVVCDAMRPKVAVSRFVTQSALRMIAAVEANSVKAGR